MLEFPQEFFDPEIREGFFVDATMKTAWAAQMEVLAQISAVCEAHNIQWYAAYGTLLGAIRHEGYVPWDDDIDIWVMREDYNKLLSEYLPQELPEGYIVKSALNDVGYSQFHSCVFNGNGINISKEWMQEFHGCPFSVFIDIFPLDYLPRDPKKREEQKTQVNLAVQAAQLAGKLGNEITDQKEVEDAIDNIKDVTHFLEREAGFRINSDMLKRKDYGQLRNQLLRCANYVAGRYGDKDADEIVQYGDYIRLDNKTFIKEWFSETYSATFETLMFPIPCGYDELLRTIYGDYTIIRKKTGKHDYPFYKPQLAYLKQALRERQRQAVAKGIVNQSEADLGALPEEWEHKLEGKKAILYVSGFSLYIEYGERAVNKLEKNLKLFQENKDGIVLWWMPQKQMRTMLGLISQELVTRYDGILEQFGNTDWAICDMSEDEERALKYCNAYYGEKNELAQQFVDMKKPVMIEQMLEDD